MNFLIANYTGLPPLKVWANLRNQRNNVNASSLLTLMNIISNPLLFFGGPCKSQLQVIMYVSPLGGERGEGGEGRGEREGEGRREERGGEGRDGEGVVILHIVSDVSNMQDHPPGRDIT